MSVHVLVCDFGWLQIQARVIKPDTFWAKCDEDSLASDDLLMSLSLTFASKGKLGQYLCHVYSLSVIACG